MKSIWMIAAVLIIVLAVTGTAAALPATVDACLDGRLSDDSYPAWIKVSVSTEGELYGDWPGWCLDDDAPTGCDTFNVVPYYESTRPADWAKMNDLLNADVHWAWSQKNKYVFANAVATFMGISLPFTPMDATEQERYNHIIATKTGYEPQCGGEDCYTVVLEPQGDKQPVVICVPTPECEEPEIPSPEFPTLAVPVGMLLGLLAVIVYSRR